MDSTGETYQYGLHKQSVLKTQLALFQKARETNRIEPVTPQFHLQELPPPDP